MNVRRLPDLQPSTPSTLSPTQSAKIEEASARVATAAAVRPQTASQFQAMQTAAAATKLGSAQTGDHLTSSVSLGQTLNGPVSLRSREAKAAIDLVTEKLNQTLSRSVGDASSAFTPRSVDQDELGMLHVRMDRVHNGLPVFGEQVIGHIRDGEVTSLTGEAHGIDPELGKGEPKFSAGQAKGIALSQFGHACEGEPTVRKVIAQDAQGNYRVAYQVEAKNLSAASGPMKMNYLVDAETGETLKSWNQLGGGFVRPEDRSKLAKAGGQGSKPEVAPEISGSAKPEAKIEDNSTVTSEIELDGDFAIENATVDLDIDHTYRGDLIVTLTSPSGKTATLSNKQGGGDDNIKESFDLSDFAGEPTKGKWILKVQDTANADTGTLHSWNLKLTGKDPNPPPPPPPAIDDHTQYSGTVQIDASKKGNDFVLKDGSRGKGVETKDAGNQSNHNGAKDIKDANNVWGEVTDDPRAQAGVDAHYGGQMTYDFYRDVLGRNSIDGNGEKLVSNVHINQNYVNAYWDGEQMNYGDGDGQDASVLTTLDIAGHEITHGLTERTAGLIYSGESGGLNEAMSDIMGTGVEWYASQKNSAVKFDFVLGEDCWTPNNGDDTDGLRYMDDPTKDGYSVDNYKNYPKQTEVHGSSGIANNAFTLLVKGGTNRTSGIQVADGIGMEKSLKIFGRALMNYMTPSTTFAQARAACVSAATDLYGADSVEVQKVKESWTAVGVN